MFKAAQSGRERDTGGPRGPKSVRAAARTAQKLPPPICQSIESVSYHRTAACEGCWQGRWSRREEPAVATAVGGRDCTRPRCRLLTTPARSRVARNVNWGAPFPCHLPRLPFSPPLPLLTGVREV